MRPAARRVMGWGAAVVALVVIAVTAGLVPIAASSGHWRITNTVLDFAKRRSVALRAWPLIAPDLTVPSRVVLGAAHYDVGCRPCHGRPGLVMPLVPHRMTPHPPDLQRQAGRWSAEELFYLVKHGIKFTGMPAWPYADRDDEVWAVVAFVRRLPTMDADTYERTTMTGAAGVPLASPDSDEAAPRRTCARCHGVAGEGGRAGELVPRIGGQRRAYVQEAIEAYASGARRSGIMGPIAAALTPREVATLADYYAATPSTGEHDPAASAGPATDDAGSRIANHGLPEQDVPACVTCHLTGAAPTVNPSYPRIAGLGADYLEQQLRLFAEGRRGGGPYAHLMAQVAAGLTVEQRRLVADFFASQPWRPTPASRRD